MNSEIVVELLGNAGNLDPTETWVPSVTKSSSS